MNIHEITNYPTEFLYTLSANCLLVHEIRLKIHVPVMFLCNRTPSILCNGTRLKVIALQKNLIEPDILTVNGRLWCG